MSNETNEPASSPEDHFRSLLAIETFDGIEDEAALDVLGQLIDFSFDLQRAEGTNRAIQLGSELSNRPLTPNHAVLLEYFLSNAWANKPGRLRHDRHFGISRRV